MKELMEKRVELMDQMNAIVTAAETETRSLTAEEAEKFDACKAEIEAIDKTIKAKEEARNMEKFETPAAVVPEMSVEEKEYRAFDKMLRGMSDAEIRANMVDGSSGVVLPKTISQKILAAVKTISPILEKADLYEIKGTLVFPKYDESSNAIAAAYASEFTDLTANSGNFVTVSLGQNLAGAMVKISRSLINNASFDVVGYAIQKTAEAIAKFLENELLMGTGASGHMTGVTVGATTVTAAAAAAISADDLIATQMAVKQQYRDSADACWIMNTATFTAVRKLQANNEYLLAPDFRAGFGYTLLGHHVYETEALENIAAGKKVAVFGDFSGLAVRITPEVQVQVLNEHFAAQHATGLVAWVEADSKVTEPDKLAVLKMKAS